MRTRWSTPEWRFFATKQVFHVTFRDGSRDFLTMDQVEGVDPNDIESCSVYVPTSKPGSYKDERALHLYGNIVDMLRLHKASITEMPM